VSYKNIFAALFGNDDRIDFYAKIFAALVASGEQIGDTNAKIKAAGEIQFTDNDDRKFFAERVLFYLAAYAANYAVINKIIRRIAHFHKLYPSWILEARREFLEVARCANDGLQDRVYEFVSRMQSDHLPPPTEERLGAEERVDVEPF
jgi:hypothetical protein